MAAISNLGYAVYEGARTTRQNRIDVIASELRSRLGDEYAIARYVDAVRASGLADRKLYVSAVLWRLQFGHICWIVTECAVNDEREACAPVYAGILVDAFAS